LRFGKDAGVRTGYVAEQAGKTVPGFDAGDLDVALDTPDPLPVLPVATDLHAAEGAVIVEIKTSIGGRERHR
jgi:hypothetical protein